MKGGRLLRRYAVHLGLPGSARLRVQARDATSYPDFEIDAAVRTCRRLDVYSVCDRQGPGFPLARWRRRWASMEWLSGGFPPSPPPTAIPAPIQLLSKSSLPVLDIDAGQRRTDLFGHDPRPFDPATGSDGPEAIISIGAGLTTVAVHENGVPPLRSYDRRRRRRRHVCASWAALDLPVADAEVTKRNLDQSAPHIRVALTAAREASMSLIGELRSSVDYYATLTGRSPVRRVVVTGGGSRLIGFIEQLQQQLRLPVVAGSTLDRIDCSRLKLPPEEITRLDSAVAVVVGLAAPGPKGVKELAPAPTRGGGRS